VNEPLARQFHYNRWANERLIEACRGLADKDLDAEGAGTYGSIRSTLQHVIHGQWAFLARLGGQAQDPRALSRLWAGFDTLALASDETSDALIAAAETLGIDSEVVLAYMGKSHRYPRSFFLLHAVQHGVEHRTQIGMMLARLGHEPPDLDSWAFAEHTGLGEEV
jgi:uncharacterized damage-inducible protein DinB